MQVQRLLITKTQLAQQLNPLFDAIVNHITFRFMLPSQAPSRINLKKIKVDQLLFIAIRAT